ncbi:inhibitor of growth protein 4 [Protopterus annectens]|uniref:inhibitor of growth protein 4 n=1 Tax=Protopterus annectens TaxID=7888 RepID=UPI001CFA0E6D|nr:inhibitor of growth protein 4 [Protopterus annectens]
MAAGMYLEHYLDSIENLPFELQRNFQLMRDLDQRTEDLKAEIDKLATEYISSARTHTSEQKLALLKRIQDAYSKCKEFGDDKVQLAMQTYEMVDKHIRRLDTDLARFEADLKEKQIESSDYDSSSSKGKKKGRGHKEKKAARARSKVKNSDEDTPKNGQKKMKLAHTQVSILTSSHVQLDLMGEWRQAAAVSGSKSGGKIPARLIVTLLWAAVIEDVDCPHTGNRTKLPKYSKKFKMC